MCAACLPAGPACTRTCSYPHTALMPLSPRRPPARPPAEELFAAELRKYDDLVLEVDNNASKSQQLLDAAGTSQTVFKRAYGYADWRKACEVRASLCCGAALRCAMLGCAVMCCAVLCCAVVGAVLWRVLCCGGCCGGCCAVHWGCRRVWSGRESFHNFCHLSGAVGAAVALARPPHRPLVACCCCSAGLRVRPACQRPHLRRAAGQPGRGPALLPGAAGGHCQPAAAGWGPLHDAPHPEVGGRADAGRSVLCEGDWCCACKTPLLCCTTPLRGPPPSPPPPPPFPLAAGTS